MKSMLIVAALMIGSVAMAEGTAAPAAGAAAAPAAPAAEAPAKKLDKKAARAECKKENKDLKGKALAECVKSKTM